MALEALKTEVEPELKKIFVSDGQYGMHAAWHLDIAINGLKDAKKQLNKIYDAIPRTRRVKK